MWSKYRYNSLVNRGIQVFIALVLMTLLAVSIIVLKKSHAESGAEVRSLSNGAQRSYWTQRIAAVGPANTYAEFKMLYAADPRAGHTAAHLFGDILYRQVGERAFVLCDDALGYGCIHQVVADLVEDKGPRSVIALEHFCIQTFPEEPTFCIHGMGHGIEEYYREDLSNALHQCESLETTPHQRSCAAGVFMEYLVPEDVQDSSGALIQPLATDMHAPCAGPMPEKFVNTCYYSLPHWWFALRESPSHVVALCEKLPKAARSMCASGMGIDLPGVVAYDRSLIQGACNNFGSTDDQAVCLKTSSESLRSLGVE